MRKKTLTREDLFVEPNFDELKEIAIDPSTGANWKLNRHQLQSIRVCGEFDVDSKEFPNQKHKWLLNRFLIKGTDKTHDSFLSDLAKALHLLSKSTTSELTVSVQSPIHFCLTIL